MNRTLLTLGIVVLVAIAGVFGMMRLNSQNRQTQNSTPLPSNSAAVLLSDKNTELVSEDVSYYPNAKGLYVRPEAEGDYPGIIMIHENRGLTDSIKQTAQEVAKEGYQVLAVDLFSGQVAVDQNEARAITQALDRAEALKNLQEGVKFLQSKNATKIGSWGWCFGGGQSLALSMSNQPLDATVIYYGTPLITDKTQLQNIKWPVLGIFGDKDQAIPVERVNEFETALNDLNIENIIHIYPGVGHAFANPTNQNHAPNETKDAWLKTLEFLNQNLKTS